MSKRKPEPLCYESRFSWKTPQKVSDTFLRQPLYSLKPNKSHPAVIVRKKRPVLLFLIIR
jgi:hypothetical protein